MSLTLGSAPDPPVANGPFLLLANPRAGRGRAAGVLADVLVALRQAGAQATGELTTSAGHATELAEVAAANGVVSVAVGGDGLLRAVAAGAAPAWGDDRHRAGRPRQ